VDYQWKARGENWQAQAERPWDTPLTQGGIDQGAACGRAIVEHCERLGLAPVRKVCIDHPIMNLVSSEATFDTVHTMLPLSLSLASLSRPPIIFCISFLNLI
jgi:hypothetical protein